MTVEDTRQITVLYDERCALCRRCRDWLSTQPCMVPVALVPAGSPDVRWRYPQLEPWLGHELVVVDNEGRGWIGPAAFVVCLWATARYRSISYTLARPAFAPLAEQFFMFVSKRRDRFGSWVDPGDADCSWCEGVMVTRDARETSRV
ncbi:MAG: DCC1-like thiol-disulfide oxidoreductase family protein [Actinomycetota bacterium]